MPRRKKPEPPAAGTFRPAVPADSQEVVILFAVAARAVCARPDQLDVINRRLSLVTERLVPPESLAALECRRLWSQFTSATQMSKPALHLEAGRALCRDLESLGQRLDLPPLASWDRLPDAIEAQRAPADVEAPAAGCDLNTARELARSRLGRRRQPRTVATEVASIIGQLHPGERARMVELLVGGGHLGRSDCSLATRWLANGGAITDEDEALIGVLARIGEWLTR